MIERTDSKRREALKVVSRDQAWTEQQLADVRRRLRDGEYRGRIEHLDLLEREIRLEDSLRVIERASARIVGR